MRKSPARRLQHSIGADPAWPVRVTGAFKSWSRVCIFFLLAPALLNLALGQEESSLSELGRGLIYNNEWTRSIPWSVHILQIDRSREDFELVTTIPDNRTIGLSPLTEQIRAIPSESGRPLAAINGDFFHLDRDYYPGDPRGIQIFQGEIVSAPDGKASFWIDAKGVPRLANVSSQFRVTWPGGETTPCGLNEERGYNSAVLYTSRLGSSTRTRGGRELVLERSEQDAWLPLRVGQTYKAKVREVRDSGNSRLSAGTLVLSLGPFMSVRAPNAAVGSILKISTATTPDLSGARTALGGGPILVHDGKVQSFYEHRSDETHPRQAIGWNSKYFFFVAVDGRQPHSRGMTLQELAAYLVRKGCDEAMNLDGGGSAEMWVEGKIVNSICYQYERSTANALVLLQKKKIPAP